MTKLQTLPNGVRVALEKIDGVRSCAMGVWLEIGSRNELPEEAGLTHFIEHMLFKGTTRHDALALADELDRLGGHVNALTSQEALCLHAQCIDSKAPRTLELLTEMVLDSTYPEEEIRRERNVILEEYKMYEDNPDDMIVDVFYQKLWPRSPLGRPVIGTPRTIRRFSSLQIHKYLQREFDPRKLLIVLAGKFDTRECMEILRATFGRLPSPKIKKAAAADTADAARGRKLLKRETEQVHFCFGCPGPDHASSDRFAFSLMNLILGGGMSSRLFKEVREKRGLAYSIQSFSQRFRGSGSFAIAGATSPSNIDEVVKICLRELERLCRERIDKKELESAKEQVHDSILMSLESTSSRMMRVSESILSQGRIMSYHEVLRNVMRVNADEIGQVARRYFEHVQFAGAFIGPRETRLNPTGKKLSLRAA